MGLGLQRQGAESGSSPCGRAAWNYAETKGADQRGPELTDSGVKPSLISRCSRTKPNFRFDPGSSRENEPDDLFSVFPVESSCPCLHYVVTIPIPVE